MRYLAITLVLLALLGIDAGGDAGVVHMSTEDADNWSTIASLGIAGFVFYMAVDLIGIHHDKPRKERSDGGTREAPADRPDQR